MASKQTSNYGLNQWELSDSVVMDDFNEDNQKIDAALAAGPKVQTGTYTGTGEYGAEHPNVLTFDFQPKLVLINGVLEGGDGANSSDHYSFIAVQGTKSCYATYWGGSSTTTVALHWGNNSLSWYGGSAQKQGNWLNAVYHYVAIG